MTAPTIAFDDLATADLIVDAVYEGGHGSSITNERIHHLLPVGRQPYREIRGDGHPVVIVSGVDVVEALRGASIASVEAVEAWLTREFKL